jgi:hypothetical protein
MGIFQAIAAGIGIGGGGALSYAGQKMARKAMTNQIKKLQSGLRGIGTQVGAAYGTLGRETAGLYQPLLDYQQQSSDQILNRFIAERQANTDQYRQGYEQNISQFQSAYDTIRQQYAAGMERVYGEAASGRQAMISNSRRATYGYDQRIEVHGALGSVSAENQRPVSIEVASAKGYTRPPLHDFFMTRYTEAYAAEISGFIAALSSKTPASPSGEDGLIALALAEACLKSVAEGRVVKMAEIL